MIPSRVMPRCCTGVGILALVSGALGIAACNRSPGDAISAGTIAEYTLPRCQNPIKPRSSTTEHPLMLSYGAVASISETDWPQAELLSVPVWEREVLRHEFGSISPVLPPGFVFLSRGTLACVVRIFGERSTVIPADGPLRGQWFWVDSAVLSEEIPSRWKPGDGIVPMHNDGERRLPQVVRNLLAKRRLPHL
jgi:hypothetical protein